MTLATHAVVGAAITRLFPANPILGLSLAVASHFLLDTIPHWDYHLNSLPHSAKVSDQLQQHFRPGWVFLSDLLKTGADGLIGWLLALALFQPMTAAALGAITLGALAGVLPDFLQFVYYRWHPRWLGCLQRFHLWVHARSRLDGRPVLGVITQTFLVLLSLFVLK